MQLASSSPDAVQRKAVLWWNQRHSGFNSRRQTLIIRLLDAEPAGFMGSMILRKEVTSTGHLLLGPKGSPPPQADPSHP